MGKDKAGGFLGPLSEHRQSRAARPNKGRRGSAVLTGMKQRRGGRAPGSDNIFRLRILSIERGRIPLRLAVIPPRKTPPCFICNHFLKPDDSKEKQERDDGSFPLLLAPGGVMRRVRD